MAGPVEEARSSDVRPWCIWISHRWTTWTSKRVQGEFALSLV